MPSQPHSTAPERTTRRPVRPFLDWPVVTEPANWNADVMLIGLPLGEPYPGDAFPNDQALAPDAIRLQSRQFCDGLDHWDFDLGSTLGEILPPRCIDGGNLLWSSGSYANHIAYVREVLGRAFSLGTQVFVLGGDHGVTIPVLEAVDSSGLQVHVLHIDAHLDWRDEVGGVRWGYSSPLRRASELSCVTGMTQIGLRGTGSARAEEVAAARAYGSTLIPAAQVHEGGLDQVLASIPPGAVYVTIDADGLDPSAMPAVQAPSPGGLSARLVIDLLLRLGRRHLIVGMDVVEVAPTLDLANKLTCITAGRLILSALGASWRAEAAWRKRRSASG